MSRSFRFVNLLDNFPGKNGKGDLFPMRAAARRARKMANRRGTFVLAGKLVARAFGLGRIGYFEWAEIGGRPAVVFPHPSGINTWWNDPGNRARARRFFARNFLA